MKKGNNRLAIFFGASMLVHACVCVCGASFDVTRKAKAETYYDVALLREQPKPETTLVAPPPEPPKQKIRPHTKTTNKPKESHAPKVVIKAPEVQPEPPREHPKPVEQPKPVETAPPVLTSAVSTEPALTTTETPAPVTEGRGGNGNLENEGSPRGDIVAPPPVDWKKAYKRKIYSQIQRSKRYPYEARRSGMEGRVVVRFSISSSGEIVSLSVVSASPYDILNSDALAWVRRAAPFPPFPPEADASSISLTYGLKYDLTD